MKALTVVQPFGGFERGSQITDPKKIAEVLDSPQAVNVVLCELPDKDPPSAKGDHD